jgi:hypothetical protein
MERQPLKLESRSDDNSWRLDGSPPSRCFSILPEKKGDLTYLDARPTILRSGRDIASQTQFPLVRPRCSITFSLPQCK